MNEKKIHQRARYVYDQFSFSDPWKIRRHLEDNVQIDSDGCWIWQKGINDKRWPYGVMTINHIKIKTHRVSAIVYLNMDLKSNFHVLHSCDKPRCINPDHLSLGTHKDNMRGMMERGRHVSSKGEKNGLAKLKLHQVKEIRERKKKGESYSSIARSYGVSLSTPKDIIAGRTWK